MLRGGALGDGWRTAKPWVLVQPDMGDGAISIGCGKMRCWVEDVLALGGGLAKAGRRGTWGVVEGDGGMGCGQPGLK